MGQDGASFALYQEPAQAANFCRRAIAGCQGETHAMNRIIFLDSASFRGPSKREKQIEVQRK